MSRLAEWILQACNTLGLRVDIGISIFLSDEHEFQVIARIHDVGAKSGMLVVSDYSDISNYLDELSQMGYGYSVLDQPLENETFDLESFINMFCDWGWSGVDEQKPSWMRS